MGRLYSVIRRHPVRSLILFIAIVIILVVLIYSVLGYKWLPWTGFGEYQIVKIDPATNLPTEFQVQSRTLWDWLQLLIIPAMLALVALWFNTSQRKNELKIAEKRAETDREHQSY